MKFFLLISFTVVFLLSSCEKQKLLNETGIYRSPNGNWKVELLNEAPGLRITELKKRLGPSKGAKPKGRKAGKRFTPQNWVSSPGAFVYFDDANHVWAFDGRSRTIIVGKDKKSGELLNWTLDSYPGQVPSTFAQMKAGAQAH